MAKLGQFNGLIPDANILNYGLHLVLLGFDGSVSVYSAWAKQTIEDCSGLGPSRFKNFEDAAEYMKKSAAYVWDHNDQKDLIESYGLSPIYVKDFLRRCWPSDVERPSRYTHPSY